MLETRPGVYFWQANHPDWAATRDGAEAIRKSLGPLLQREVDVVLPTHGLPAYRDALVRALAQV